MTSPLSPPDISAPEVFEHRFDCIFHHLAATETGPLHNISDPRHLQKLPPHLNVWQDSCNNFTSIEYKLCQKRTAFFYFAKGYFFAFLFEIPFFEKN